MMKNQISSPAISFFEVYKNNILSCRQELFKELGEVSLEFAKEAKNILEVKLQSEINPPMGELFPWLIKDLTDSDAITTQRISVGWLAIYLYTLFLDEYVDNPKLLSPAKFITGSLLAKTGLLKIAHFTFNTPYEGLFENALTYSAANQQLDVKFQKENTNLQFKKRYSEGKNYVVLACAGALAAQNSKHSDFIIQITQKLLLTFQYLDDLADFHDDFNRSNYTVLLNDAFSDNPDFMKLSKARSKKEILVHLLESGALYRVTKKIIDILDESLILIKKNNLDNNRKSSVKFFSELEIECNTLINYLTYPKNIFRAFPKRKQNFILDRIEKQLIIIADAT
jgi:hypothetical protein